MVLLAAAVCTKGGKPLVSRQFVENMTRSRIEGILAAFPKLMTGDKSSHKQHTFVETDSVRYVYQPIDQLYVVLITTKNSNILEDLETLRLFSRVIPEYCKTMDEKEILDNAFQLIFAFDEIVAIGYRESVSLAQIRTFTDMDSHEERVYYQIKKSQEEEAKKYARDKARELTKAKLEAAKKGIKPTALIGSAYGSQSAKYEPSAVAVTDNNDYKPSYTAPAPKPGAGPNKALRLGAKTKDVDTFVDQLKSEGQDVSAFAKNQKIDVSATSMSTATRKKAENVHIKAEEKLKLMISRDGKVNEFDVSGCITLRISDENSARIKLRLENNDKTDVQLQTHPNLDKRAFQAENMLVLKNAASKPYPVNVDVGILKWRFHSDNDAHLPLSINCWPSESSTGCDVNIEYTLENENMQLDNVKILIPLPTNVAPVVGECTGDYKYDKARSILEWQIAVIDKSSKQGTLEFTSSAGHADNFFPVIVQFTSESQFIDLKISEIYNMDNEQAVKFSSESLFKVENFEIV